MKKERFRYIAWRNWLYDLILLGSFLLILLVYTGIVIVERRYVIPLIGGYLILIVLAGSYYYLIYRPYQEMVKVLRMFAGGYTMQGIFEYPFYLTPELADAIHKFEELLDKNEMISASKKQAEYLALQNQINPHFLYNTLEGIRGETLNAGLDNVAKMTEALATFFRYTISNVDHLVTLEDELKNIENYYIIQQYRFGERLNLNVEWEDEMEEELLKCRLPKLTLQPIVENAIYHGLERKIGKGNVNIKIQSTRKRLIITISDDGIGMSRERLQEITDKLHNLTMDYVKPDSEAKGGIAIVNVNSRIKLLFGEDYGICFYSTLNSGTDVEITLPVIIEGDDEFTWKKY